LPGVETAEELLTGVEGETGVDADELFTGVETLLDLTGVDG